MKTRLLLCLALALSGVCHAEIIYPQAPKGGDQVVSNHLESRFLKGFTRLPPVKQLTIAQPFGVYFYDKNYTNLFSGRFLSETRLGGWRFLLTDGTNSAGLDLGYDEKNRKWSEFGCSFYPACPNSSDPVLGTLRAAAKLPQVKIEDFELRYLNFLDIQFFAIWLHGKSNDIFIPVPVYGKWQDYRPYSEREIIKLLKPDAKIWLKQPERRLIPGPPG